MNSPFPYMEDMTLRELEDIRHRARHPSGSHRCSGQLAHSLCMGELLSQWESGVAWPLLQGLCQIHSLTYQIPSAQGLIRVKVDAHEGRYDLVTHVPDGSLAVLHLPAASEYTYDGETINFEDMPSSSNYRLLSIGPEGLQIELLPGEHVFSCLVVAY